jgi:hypothetical protein
LKSVSWSIMERRLADRDRVRFARPGHLRPRAPMARIGQG